MNSIRWTSSGFEAPVVSPNLHTTTDQRYRSAFTLDGNKFASTIGGHPVPSSENIMICDFDQSTGQFSNPMYLDLHVVLPSGHNIIQNYGIAFSPDGSKLYTSINKDSPTVERLIQFDLSAGTVVDIQSSLTVIAQKVPPGIGGIQNGPDGRLYISNGDGSLGGLTTIHVIDFPNLAGVACTFKQDFLDVGGETGSGLNNIVYGLGPSSCIPLIDLTLGSIVCSELVINTNLNSCYLGAGGPYDVYYNYEGVPDTVFNQNPDGAGLITLTGLSLGSYTDVLLTDANGCASNAFDIVLAPDASCPELCDNNIDDDLDGDVDELDADCCEAQAPILGK